jgi:large subunit ribosomal protein L10e
MGNARKEYPYQVLLVSEEDIQVQHNALEACRVAINKIVETEVGIENYHFQVRAYPHHVLRENAIITGAGADRLQTGMRHSFGKPKSRAARIKRGGLVYSIKVGTEKDVETARRALKSVKSKLPMKTSVQTKKL